MEPVLLDVSEQSTYTDYILVLSGRSDRHVQAVADAVAESTDRDVAIEGSPRQNPITHRHFDTAAVRGSFPTFGWTPLREGIARTVAEMP